ncbi:chaperone NapD [Paraglaciecola sp.]|uniref:chaperone NapD n=1 Tax=Paraglaciecola sp. TaxID=1920173 RepID=UPI003EF45B5E
MSEYHISSFIVRCHKEHVTKNVEKINQIEGAEVHEFEPTGKLIVTAEGFSHRAVSNITELIRDMPQVVDVAAVYHEYTPDAEM